MKRQHPAGGDRSDDRYAGKRAAHQGAPHRGPSTLSYAFKLLCPEALVVHLLSKRRAQVRTIEGDTHARLKFSQRGEFYPETDLRVLAIFAAEEHMVQDAINRLVDEVIWLADSALEDCKVKSGFRMFCALGKESAGNVIGQKGQRIQALRKETGARIKIDSAVVEGNQLATIEGSRDQLVDIFGVLAEAVNRSVEEPWFAEWARQMSFDGSGDGRSWPSEPPQTGRIRHGGGSGGKGARSKGSRGPPEANTGGLGQVRRYVFKVLCTDPLAANLIGKAGVERANMEEETGCSMWIGKRESLYPAPALRVIILHADEASQLQAALDRIVPKLIEVAERDRENGDHESPLLGKEPNEYVFHAAIPSFIRGALIGTKGAVIQKLREESGAKIFVENETYDNHQAARIIGSQEKINNVVSIINDMVQEEASQDTEQFTRWAKVRDFYESRHPRYEQEIGRDDTTIFVGGLTQSVRAADLEKHFAYYGPIQEADVISDHATGRSKGFGFVAFADAAAVEKCLRFTNEHVFDGKLVEVKRYGDERARSGGEWSSPSSGSTSWRGDAPSWRPGRRDLQWFTSIVDSVNPEYLGYAYNIQTFLPDEKCGAVLGNGGQNIRSVEGRTRTAVHLQKKEESENGFRQLSMEGSLMSVYAAHMLLMRTYHEEEAKRHRKASRESGDNGRRERHDNRKGAGEEIEEMRRQIEKLQAKLEGR